MKKFKFRHPNLGGKRRNAGRGSNYASKEQLITVTLPPIQWQHLTALLHKSAKDRGQFIYKCYLENEDE